MSGPVENLEFKDLCWEACQSVVFIGSGGAAAAVLGSPMGLVGGTLLGAGMHVARPVEWLSSRLYNSHKDDASLVSKVATYATSTLATAYIAFSYSHALGVKIAFTHILAMTTTTFLIASCALYALCCLFPNEEVPAGKMLD
jgi:hypothetical protein